MKRPTIKSPCNADRYADPRRERIAEFSTPCGKGGLIRVHECDNGNVTVEVYRQDEGVTVIAATGNVAHVNKLLPLPAYVIEEDALAKLVNAATECLATASPEDRVLRPFITAGLQELEDRGVDLTKPRPANDTVDALVQAEAQLEVFAKFDAGNGGEDSDLKDALAGIKAAIQRERARTSPDVLAALTRAESFIAGFEDDNMQEGISEMLAGIKAAIAAMEAAGVAAPAPTFDAVGAFNLLCKSFDAWDDEEESVKEEHEDLIGELDDFIEKNRATIERAQEGR